MIVCYDRVLFLKYEDREPEMMNTQYSLSAFLAVCILSLSACATQNNQIESADNAESKAVAEADKTVAQQDEIEDKYGIRVLSIRLSAANYMLDFRYHVSDVEKAEAILTRKIKPHVIIEDSGRKLVVPVYAKLCTLRPSPKYIETKKKYFAFFANPEGAVKSGDKVTVVMGEAKIEHLVVQ